VKDMASAGLELTTTLTPVLRMLPPCVHMDHVNDHRAMLWYTADRPAIVAERITMPLDANRRL
jgi:hypothetical protein